MLLELEPPFEARDVQLARRAQAKRWHPDLAPPGRQFEHERHLKAINEAADQLENLAAGARGGRVTKNAVKVSAAAARAARAEAGARAYEADEAERSRDTAERRRHDPFGSRVPDHSVVHRYARCLSYPEWGVGEVSGIYFTGAGDDVQQWARVRFHPGIRTVPAGSQGLVCQPYWTPGPDLEPYAKGAVFGFGDVHTRAHLYRAILEGIVFAMKDGAHLTEKKNGVAIEALRATGGGSRSDSIMQMTADIFDLPVSRPHTPETSVVGAAMDAAVGLGVYANIAEAAEHMTRTAEVFTPDPANRDLYRELYERVYAKSYEQLKPLYKEIQQVTGYPKL